MVRDDDIDLKNLSRSPGNELSIGTLEIFSIVAFLKIRKGILNEQ